MFLSQACNHESSGSIKTFNTSYLAFRSQVWKVLLWEKEKNKSVSFLLAHSTDLQLLRIPFWQEDLVRGP